MDSNDSLLYYELLSTAKEIKSLLQLLAWPRIKEVLEHALNTDEKRLVYVLMDGIKTVTQIQELANVNSRFISEWGQEWEKIGIVESSKIKGRRKSVYSLQDFDIKGRYDANVKENKIE
jgi:hypothetical protein